MAPPVAAWAALGSPGAGELARRILAEGDYQTELPAGASLPPGLPGLGGLLAVLLWTGLAVGVVLVAVWLAGRLVPSAPAEGTRPGERPAGEAALDHDEPARLAAAGRHAEAIHAMLLLAIQRHAARIQPAPPESATSREVLGVLPLDRPRREALADLVREVELSLFGGRPVGEEQYRRCLRSFEMLGEERT